MRTRAAVAFEAGRPLEIVDVELNGPREGEVLIGACHVAGGLPGLAGRRSRSEWLRSRILATAFRAT